MPDSSHSWIRHWLQQVTTPPPPPLLTIGFLGGRGTALRPLCTRHTPAALRVAVMYGILNWKGKEKIMQPYLPTWAAQERKGLHGCTC
eukprot:scaffold141369_cov23-Tisochrysis_lutea.AAC.1